MIWFIFFFNDTATTEIYTLSLHDALPILAGPRARAGRVGRASRGEHPQGARDELDPHRALLRGGGARRLGVRAGDRKSTRLNSSHANISYAVFCLKKKKTKLLEKKSVLL